MKKLNKKKFIITIICLLLIICLFIFIISSCSKTKIIDNLKIYDVKTSQDMSVFKYQFKIKNKDSTRTIKYIMITIKYDKDKELILYGNIGKIKENEVKEIIATSDIKINKIEEVKYQIIK